MSVEKIMTTSLVTVGLDDTLAELNELFARHKFHHLLVLYKGKLAGVVSDRDVLKAMSPNLGTAAESSRDLATLRKRVHQIMQRQLVTLTKDASIYDAVALFNRERVSCIPVVDNDMHPVGIISWRDIMRALEAQYVKKKKESSISPTNS